VSAATVFVFLLMFADSGERAAVQGVMMGGAILVVTSLLLVLSFLDNPYRGGLGGMRPVAMERTVQVLSRETGFADGSFDIPCDSNGVELTPDAAPQALVACAARA